jgi:hypothetical protein
MIELKRPTRRDIIVKLSKAKERILEEAIKKLLILQGCLDMIKFSSGTMRPEQWDSIFKVLTEKA